MLEDCPDCQKWRDKDASFCASCGKYLREKPAKKQARNPFFHLMVLLSITIVVFIVAVNTAYCLLYFDSIVDDCENLHFGVELSFGLEDWVLFKVTGAAGVAVMLALYLLVEVACIGYAIWRFIPQYRNEISTGDESCTEKTGLAASSAYLAVSLLLSVAFLLTAAASGNGADSSWMDKYTDNQLEFMLTRAGVREELMYRMFWIGIPMMIIAAVIRKDHRAWQYLFGGFGMTKVAFVFIIVSTVLFGLAHNSNWGAAKVIDAMIAGVIFGYLYTEYGLYACIIAHTANDVTSSILYIGLGQGIELMALFGLIALGLLILIYWLIKPNHSLCDVWKYKTFPEKLECNLWRQWGRH